MPLIQVVEQVKELVVGRFYLVDSIVMLPFLAVDSTLRIPRSLMPLHGPSHNDRDIGADFEHWHIDWRFVEKKIFKKFMAMTKYEMPWERVIPPNYTNGAVKKSVMKCKRLFAEYPKPLRILKILEPIHKDSVMKNFICPHKGLPCNAIPVVNGVVTCRGHGLSWNVETGRLVRKVFPPPLVLET